MTLEEPRLTREGDAYVYSWPAAGVGIGFDLLRESHGGLQGEMCVETNYLMPSGANGHIAWGLYNLSAIETRVKTAERLTELTHVDNREEWFKRLEYACYTTATLWRRGAKTLRIRDLPETRGVDYLVDRLLPLGQTTILYGRGGGGKGWLVSAMALAVAGQHDLPGIRPVASVPTLYLDWEATEIEARRRFGWLCRGLHIPEIPENLYYRNMTRPLVDEARAIRADLTRLGIGFIIIDSLVPACGEDPTGADPARQVMDAMRTFTPATRLVVAHMTRAGAQGSGESDIFGSIFFRNLGRSVWELRCTDASESEMEIGLYHRKVNLGAKQPPVGWRLNWKDQEYTASLNSIVVTESSDLVRHASLSVRIRAALRQGAMEAPTLAEALGVSQDVLRAECNRMRDVVNLTETTGRGAHARWGLISSQKA